MYNTYNIFMVEKDRNIKGGFALYQSGDRLENPLFPVTDNYTYLIANMAFVVRQFTSAGMCRMTDLPSSIVTKTIRSMLESNVLEKSGRGYKLSEDPINANNLKDELSYYEEFIHARARMGIQEYLLKRDVKNYGQTKK